MELNLAVTMKQNLTTIYFKKRRKLYIPYCVVTLLLENKTPLSQILLIHF